jgi:hypothetical protein
LCVERIDGTSVTLFSTGTSRVEDEITLEELKREKGE